jgi:hypothetical protein
MKTKSLLILVAIFSIFTPLVSQNYFLPGDSLLPWEGGNKYYAQWKNGPSAKPDHFPIAVWWQDIKMAAEYKSIGINYYLYLGTNPVSDQLKALAAFDISVACISTESVVKSADNKVVKMWMNPRDEQDNALKGTSAPVPTAEVIDNYNKMKADDPTRPVLVPLGQGAAIDSWYGRGDRTGHPEDYIEYCKGADIITFDVYPMNVVPVPEDAKPYKKVYTEELRNNIWYVAKGVDNLRRATNYKKPIWAWIECTNYKGDSSVLLTPHHTKVETWMAIIHGARGIGYFCHAFKPTFNQAALLADVAMKETVAEVNKQINSLAPVLNTQSISNAATLISSNSAVPIDIMAKRYKSSTYIFAVSMRPGKTIANINLRLFKNAQVEVIGENRTIACVNGTFSDSFSDYSVHIYKIKNPKL